MNKQELIEKIKANGEWLETNRYVKITKVIELVNQIDEPQKVKVPEEFDEWYQQIEQRWGESATNFALWKICQYGFGNGFEDVNNDRTSSALSDWVCWNKEVAINAVWNGYEVEEEPKYRVKVGNGYFINYQGRGCLISPHEKDGIMNFDSMKEANRTADIVGGTVEKV